ncbi:hypothetical protein BY09_17000, partial [Escherichia coli O157:H7 str. 2011EL-1107]
RLTAHERSGLALAACLKTLGHGHLQIMWFLWQTDSCFPGKERNTATSAAGVRCNEKNAFVTPGVRRLNNV